MKKIKFKELVTSISEDILENTVIETDLNTGFSVLEFHNIDGSLADDQKEQYDFKYATLCCFKDEYFDKNKEDFSAILIKEYTTKEEAIEGHKKIVDFILKNKELPEYE